MKIVRLKSKPDEKGYFPLPKNLINRMMFCYPNLGEDDKYGTKERENKKVNALTCYFGELFEEMGKKWYIGAMGFDNMVIFDENNKEYDCYFRLFIYSGGQFLYVLEKDEDWFIYDKNKSIYDRMEKIDKILKNG
jgi:hypothetical protein